MVIVFSVRSWGGGSAAAALEMVTVLSVMRAVGGATMSPRDWSSSSMSPPPSSPSSAAAAASERGVFFGLRGGLLGWGVAGGVDLPPSRSSSSSSARRSSLPSFLGVTFSSPSPSPPPPPPAAHPASRVSSSFSSSVVSSASRSSMPPLLRALSPRPSSSSLIFCLSRSFCDSEISPNSYCECPNIDVNLFWAPVRHLSWDE
mmetsp:Transcript_23157/g.68348  ORF Transcript_23157/g.68348 Transcript_23157/m.68348 type:complete len:202 (+) Transcript_23157:977-1582(+)